MSAEASDSRLREDQVRLALLEALVAKPSRHNEVSFRELASVVGRHKWLICAVTLVFAVASVALALHLPNEYTATVILRPANNTGGSELGNLAGKFGGIAALAGMNLKGSSNSEKPEQAIALLRTQGFLDHFIKKYNLAVPIYASDGWDSYSNRLQINTELYNVKTGEWIKRFKSPLGPVSGPTESDLYHAFSKRIQASEDKDTGLVTLKVEFYSPYVAKQWADELVNELNRVFELQDRVEASKSIEYLNNQLQRTQVADMRTYLYLLLEEQLKKLMLTKVSNGYVFETLSPAFVPDQKSGPHRLVIAALGTILGAGAAVVGSVLWDRSRTPRGKQRKSST